MKFSTTVFLAIAICAVQPVKAIEETVGLEGFNFSVPSDWKRVGEQSKFVEKDGYISPKIFNLDGKEMPITMTARRMERDPDMTEKSFEERLGEYVKKALEKAKADLGSPDYLGPKVLKSDLDGCVFSSRRVGGKRIFTSTFIAVDKEFTGRHLVTKSTTVAYVDGDHMYVLAIIGVVQHYRDYEEEISKIVESAKPTRG